jgi:hypothetical protein
MSNNAVDSGRVMGSTWVRAIRRGTRNMFITRDETKGCLMSGDIRIISRGEWGARPPTRVVTTTWAHKTEFIVHYSGASRQQTVRSIQDYCMDTKGHSDVDYCFLVKDGLVYEGRGWLNIGSHTLNHNTVGIGVCVVGEDGDATEADRRAVRWLHDEACRMAGGPLVRLGHQDANPGATDCPGSQLEAWVQAGMSVIGIETIGGDDMALTDRVPLPTAFFPELLGQQDISLGELLGWTCARTRRNEVQLAELTAKVGAIAEKVDISPGELLAVTEAARKGAMKGIAESVDELVAAFVAKLPADVAARDDVVSAIRGVLTEGAGAVA